MPKCSQWLEAPINAFAQISSLDANTAPPRARGSVHLAAKARDGQSHIADLRLSGSSRALFPRNRDAALEAVLLNTSGGITGGDHFDINATALPHSHLTLTTQAAERAYRALSGTPGILDTTLTVSDHAALDWVPQETILFEGSSLRRRLRVDMATTARLLLVEPMIFGRTAMGETLHDARLNDRIEIRRAGRLLFADAIALEGDMQAQLDRSAIAGGARAMASLILVAPEAEAARDTLRALLPHGCGVSLIGPDLLFARLLAEDGHMLRKALIPALETLRARPLPRTWML
ncbi:urease accessory protein UreD [Shimia sp. FJ5]|uniref:urease accessory protein UreD n=1 Tax=Shimia sp. FJ5 TaxID=3079054 RepID=UPI00293DE4DB|nr:urease accessory protein UreD [Shimia sp. FJ5]MDV4143505.1 urease accessory protein UreD [Shimia sp. FJ5]